MMHLYNPFSGITRTFKLTLAQRFLYVIDVFAGTDSGFNSKSSVGIFDYSTGLLSYFLYRALLYFVKNENDTLSRFGVFVGILFFGVINIPFFFLRAVFTAVVMILATPVVLLTHAIFCICLRSKNFRNRTLLELCAQDEPNVDVIKMLILRGVDACVHDINENTCLDLLGSKEYPNLDLMMLLLVNRFKFTNKEYASKCLNRFMRTLNSWLKEKYNVTGYSTNIENVYCATRSLIEQGAQFDNEKFDYKVIDNKFDALIERAIQKNDYAFALFMIINAPFLKIAYLGKSEGSPIEKLIHHLAESQNLQHDLALLQQRFDEKDLEKIHNLPLKDFWQQFSNKFSTDESARILSLLCSGHVMQEKEYERIDSNIPPLPTLPRVIWGEIAKRMINKNSSAILFEVNAEDICKIR